MSAAKEEFTGREGNFLLKISHAVLVTGDSIRCPGIKRRNFETLFGQNRGGPGDEVIQRFDGTSDVCNASE